MHWQQSNFEARTHEFLKHYRRCRNDICDLFAAGSPRTMTRYARIYSKAQFLNTHLVQNSDDPSNYRIQSTSAYPFNIEESPIFVPEKLIRFQMAGFLVVHGETVVVIQRR